LGISHSLLELVPVIFHLNAKMSAKSLMLDYGLPGLVAFGTGVLTFMLTGGPDEFPPEESCLVEDGADEDEDAGEGEDMELNSQQQLSNSHYRKNESDDFMTVKDMPPDWAVEV
jgi:hypothetical protein